MELGSELRVAVVVDQHADRQNGNGHARQTLDTERL